MDGQTSASQKDKYKDREREKQKVEKRERLSEGNVENCCNRSLVRGSRAEDLFLSPNLEPRWTSIINLVVFRRHLATTIQCTYDVCT